VIVNVLTWNLEWASPRSKRGEILKEIIQEIDPDVVCYTEVVTDFLPNGYIIEADPDYGYPHDGKRRKVVLWSKTPWTEIDTAGDPRMPPGRFVSGVTQNIRFLGVCIPWSMAHVSTGRKDANPWSEFLWYLRGFREVKSRFGKQESPLCILGDMNNTAPPTYSPVRVANVFSNMLHGFDLLTYGLEDQDGRLLVDHIAISSELKGDIIKIVSKNAAEGTRLSDHVGVVADISLSESS
jgi:endonuclease/exonuclease/phosphatase family metal-dependent hydrolase